MKLILAVFLTCLTFAQAPPQKKQPSKKPPPEPFLQWLARVTGISATSSNLKGELLTFSGDVWLAHVNQPGGGERLTFEDPYAWPVFSKDDQAIIAIRNGELWSIPLNHSGPAKLQHSPSGVTSLLAASPDGIVLFIGQAVGLFYPDSGKFLPFKAATPEDRDAIDRMRWPARSYNPNFTVFVKETNIIVEFGQEKREIAPAPDERLGEPSISHDRKLLVYIRAPKIQ